MAIEEAIYTRLSTFAGLTALVSTRIHTLVLPEGVTYPAVSFFRVSGPRVHAMGSEPGLVMPRFQVSAWDQDVEGVSSGYTTARAVSAQIRAALSRWSGTVNGVVVQDSLMETERDLFNERLKVWQVASDFMIIHEE
ncbi:MAG: DUF3168 domain-containing protein [bacterium]|nr:DUF3168 domain-containing protein [bacterium]